MEPGEQVESVFPTRSRIELGGERMWVNKRFQKDIEAADARLTEPPA